MKNISIKRPNSSLDKADKCRWRKKLISKSDRDDITFNIYSWNGWREFYVFLTNDWVATGNWKANNSIILLARNYYSYV